MNNRICLLVLTSVLLILGATAPLKLVAQDAWGKYCVRLYFGGGSSCQTNIDEVLVDYNLNISNGNPDHYEWESTGKQRRTSSAREVSISYRDQKQAPTSLSQLFYTFDSIDDGGSPWINFPPGCGQPYGCASEEELVDLLVTRSDGSRKQYELSGSHDEDWSHTASFINFGGNRKIKITEYYGPGNVREFVHTLNKFQSFECAPHIGGSGRRNIGKAAAGEEWRERTLNSICGGDNEIWITAPNLQRRTCPVNENPCYPTTGDKARFEKDFSFAGYDFVRSYHSSQQAIMPGVARGWWMSFGERTNDEYGVDEFGYLDSYLSGPDGSYYSNLNEGTIVRRTSDGFSSRNSSGMHRDFDSTGALVRVYNPNQPLLDIHVEKDRLGRVLRLIDARQRTANFFYKDDTPSGLLTAIDLPDGGQVSYEYDSHLNLSKVIYPDGSQRSYHYDESDWTSSSKIGLLTGITDELGNRYATFGYDHRGRVTSSRLHAGLEDVAVTQIAYNTNSAVVSTDGAGIRTIDYSTWSVTSPKKISVTGGGQTEFSYLEDRISQAKDASGFRTTFQYAAGFLSSRNESIETSSERRYSYMHDTLGNIKEEKLAEIDEAGPKDILTRDWLYNDRNQPITLTLTDPLTGAERTRATSYCEQSGVESGSCPQVGLIVSVDGPRDDVNDVTNYKYRQSDHAGCASSSAACSFRKGDLWRITNSLGQNFEFQSYDEAGRPLAVRSPNGGINEYSYHPRGWLTEISTTGLSQNGGSISRVVRIEYWPTGLVRKVTQPGGEFTFYDYDNAHRLVAISDNFDNRIKFSLDRAGNRFLEETLDSDGVLRRELSNVYNQLGQLVTQADANNGLTDLSYDLAGNLNAITDSLGRITSREYDPLGRLVQTIQDVGGIEAGTTVAYNSLDYIAKVTDPKGLTTTYDYNGFGDLEQISSPDTGVTTYSYDSGGNRVSQVDARGQAVHYGYDPLNRLTGIDYSGSSHLNVSYVYDVAQNSCGVGESYSTGQLAAMIDASGTTQYCYNSVGDMVRKVQVTNGQTFSLGYIYSAHGRLSALSYPDGTLVDYVRDERGHVIEIGVTDPGGSRQLLLTSVTYAPFGPSTGWVYGNGRGLLRSHDFDYRPQAIHDPATGGLSLGYVYDSAGRIESLHSTDLAQLPQIKFDYDAMGRLTAFRDGVTGTAIETYAYDATGNRTSFANADGFQAYTYSNYSHQLNAVASRPRTYDAVGNLLSDGSGLSYLYSAANRLETLEKNGAARRHYSYNGKGERVRSNLFSDDVTTVYDEAGRWLGDYASDGSAKQQAIWLDDLPVGLLVQDAGNRLRYIQPDHLGTPRAVIDPVRNVAVWNWGISSEVFGSSPPHQDPDGDGIELILDLRFPGQRYDSFSQLNYNYFRDYEPAIGRYTQSDPIGLEGGISTYAYVGGNPISRTDPLGLACNGLGCWVTPAELAYANSGNYSLYYQAAASGGDEYARRAGEVAANRGLRSNYTNWNLRNSLEESGKSAEECDAAMEGIRVDLAKAHARALAGATPQNPRVLTADQISKFHNQVFLNHGAGAVFGGDTFGTSTLGRGAINKVSPWCVSPSCQL